MAHPTIEDMGVSMYPETLQISFKSSVKKSFFATSDFTAFDSVLTDESSCVALQQELKRSTGMVMMEMYFFKVI